MNTRPVVIITGASRGIGAAVARWLGNTGAAVTLVARTESGLNPVAADVAELGGKPLVIRADVADPDACRRIAESTVDRFGRLDALVNNAGIVEPLETVARTKPAQWRYNFEVNLLGPVFMVMATISELRRHRGRIVNVSSGASQHVIQAASAYCAAKAALNHFTRVLAAEEPNITAVAARPGVVDTRMQELLREKGPQKMPPQQAAYYRQLKTQGRLEPAAVPARSIAWLALHAPHQWSGLFMNYDDPQISTPAMQLFGESIEGNLYG